jgi:PPM family protein phosphatase
MSDAQDTSTLPLPGGGRTVASGAELAIEVAGFSEQGPRQENQDAFTADAFERAGLVAVADGMGGERGGRIAADTALRVVLDHAPLRSLDDARRACRAADRAVAGAANDDPVARSGMGCALGVLALSSSRSDGPFWIAAHVGDVRILSRAADGTVRLETRDHTPAFARWEAGEIDLESVPEAEGANRLQRAVGRGGDADATWIPVQPGWSYAIVSDGVTKAMRLDELGVALASPSAEHACEVIRRKVIERGPDDNFTAVVVRIAGKDPAVAPDPNAPGSSMHHHAAPRPRRSPAVVLTGFLALLALLASGIAVWLARETRASAVERIEVERLRQEMDSVRARLQQLEEPFGPVQE